MLLESPIQSHSAIIHLWLEIGDARIELTHTGPDFVHLRTPIELPPSDAVLVITINGNELRKPVRLLQGASQYSTRCEFM